MSVCFYKVDTVLLLKNGSKYIVKKVILVFNESDELQIKYYCTNMDKSDIVGIIVYRDEISQDISHEHEYGR